MTDHDHPMLDHDPLLARAFAAARAERPRSLAGKARTLAAVGLAGSATYASSPRAASVASGDAKPLLGWHWWAIGLALLATRSESTEFASKAPAPPPTVAVATTAVTVAVHDDAVEVASAPSISVDELPNAVPVAAVRRAPSPAAAAKTSSLREEVEALERASRALSQRECVLAGQHLAAYRARFPAGRLQGEAEVVEIEILGRSGQTERARMAARRFIARLPGSPYALRLAPWLNDDGSVMRCIDAR